MAEQWTGYASMIINYVEPGIKDKYKLSLTDLLSDPDSYIAKPDMWIAVENISEFIKGYVNDMISKMPKDKAALEKDAMKCDSITKQISQNISMQAKQNKVPFIKADSIERDTSKDEVINISTVDADILKLVEKLMAEAHFVSDFSSNYEEYKIGDWLFSGAKNYVIRVNMQPNSVLDLEVGREEVLDMLTGIQNAIKKE